MEKIILDTSFILSAVKKKIDFFEELSDYEILIPINVLNEIEGLKKSNSTANICLKVLEKNKFKKINFKTKNTDRGIVEYSKNNDLIIATLDKEIKNKTKNKKLVIRVKKLEII